MLLLEFFSCLFWFNSIQIKMNIKLSINNDCLSFLERCSPLNILREYLENVITAINKEKHSFSLMIY